MKKAYLNEQIKKLYNFTEADFKNWCIENNKNSSDKNSAIEFLSFIRKKRANEVK